MAARGGTDDRATARAYVRALVGALERLLHRPVILSARDWDLASDWHARGIPLGFVLELLEERRKRPPRSLAALARAVDDAWDVVRAGRRGAPEPRAAAARASRPARPGPSSATGRAEAYEAAARTAPSACIEPLEAAGHALRTGRASAEVDRALDDDLSSRCPPEWVREATRAVEEELRRSGAALPPHARERTRQRAVRDALRTRLGLPRSTA